MTDDDIQDSIKSVLIAEDDDDDYAFIREAILHNRLTIKISRAENGDVLIKILDENSPDLLFLDISMPCRDGRQCLKEIRSNKKFDLLPIIMYTALRHDQDIDYCFREGANLYALKPSSFDELTALIRNILTIDWKRTQYYPPINQFVI
ncbi:response regulator [Chryseolinea sp. T2]|uniref:response regulator n=1 Tax=Chryseolinea sp. T2 TaxID=3129255 RepID=UPI003076E6C9